MVLTEDEMVGFASEISAIQGGRLSNPWWVAIEDNADALNITPQRRAVELLSTPSKPTQNLH